MKCLIVQKISSAFKSCTFHERTSHLSTKYYRSHSNAPAGVQSPSTSTEYDALGMGFWPVKPRSGETLYQADCHTICKYMY